MVLFCTVTVRLTSLDQLWFLVCFIFSVEQHKDLIDLCVLCVGSGGHGLSPPLSPTVMSLVHRALTGVIDRRGINPNYICLRPRGHARRRLHRRPLPARPSPHSCRAPSSCGCTNAPPPSSLHTDLSGVSLFNPTLQRSQQTHRCFTLCQDNIWKMEDCSGQTLLLNTWHFLTLSLELCLLLQVVLLEKEK